jgi:hypothetical protein
VNIANCRLSIANLRKPTQFIFRTFKSVNVLQIGNRHLAIGNDLCQK